MIKTTSISLVSKPIKVAVVVVVVVVFFCQITPEIFLIWTNVAWTNVTLTVGLC